MTTFGAKFRRRLELLGLGHLTLARLADRLRDETGGVVAVSRSQMGRWKNDQRPRPNLDEGLALARLLGVTLDYLADDTQDEPPPGPIPDEEEILQIARRLGNEDVLDLLRIAQRIGIAVALRRVLVQEDTGETPPSAPSFSRKAKGKDLTHRDRNRSAEDGSAVMPPRGRPVN